MMYNKTHKMVTIYDGRTHIERRVYEKNGVEYARINGMFFNLDSLRLRYECHVWY